MDTIYGLFGILQIMTKQRLYQAVILLGLLPTIGVFSWGVYKSLQTKAETIVPLFSQMK